MSVRYVQIGSLRLPLAEEIAAPEAPKTDVKPKRSRKAKAPAPVVLPDEQDVEIHQES